MKCQKRLKKGRRSIIVGIVIALTIIVFLILNYTVKVSFDSKGWAVAAILVVALELLLGKYLSLTNKVPTPK